MKKDKKDNVKKIRSISRKRIGGIGKREGKGKGKKREENRRN